MKTKISLLILMLAGVYFNTSCDKAPDTVEIFIHNGTDSLIQVKLYPNVEYRGRRNPKEYWYTNVKDKYWRLSEYDLSSNKKGYYRWNEVLFRSYDLDVKPYTLAKKVFDSIYINTANTTLKFTHDTVIGYSENLFTENSTWDLKIEEDRDGPVSSRHQIHCYNFWILENKMTIEKDSKHESKN